MTADVIPLHPYRQLTEAQQYINQALKLVREGGHQQHMLDLLLSKAHDLILDYVETNEGR